MIGLARRFLREGNGATAIEYGLIVAVLSLAIVAGISTVANDLTYLWGNNNSRLNSAWTR